MTSWPRPAGTPASSGNVDNASAPFLVYTLTPEPRARTIPLNPSHLNSVAHWVPVGGTPSVASIGSGTAGALASVTIEMGLNWHYRAASG